MARKSQKKSSRSSAETANNLPLKSENAGPETPPVPPPAKPTEKTPEQEKAEKLEEANILIRTLLAKVQELGLKARTQNDSLPNGMKIAWIAIQDALFVAPMSADNTDIKLV